MSPPSRAAPTSSSTSVKTDVGGGLTGASSSYAIFFHEAQADLRRAYPNLAFGNLSKLISAQWCALSENEKKKYRQKSSQARQNRLRGVAFSKLNELVFSKTVNHTVTSTPTINVQQNYQFQHVSYLQPSSVNYQHQHYYRPENYNHNFDHHQNQ